MGTADINTVATVVCACAIGVGIIGAFVPLVPGLLVSWAGVLFWAWCSDRGQSVWVTFGVVTVLALVGVATKYVLPGRNLHRSGVPYRSLVVGGLLGVVGFFAIPVIGLVLGFVLGIFVAELVRLDSARLAWPSTWRTVTAVGLSMLIEMGAGLLILTVWVLSLFLL